MIYYFYYNFIRPHMSLNGKIPAEEAEIDLNLSSNKWLDLLLLKRNLNLTCHKERKQVELHGL